MKRKQTAKARVVFMCPYGGAKSVVAASYFNGIAKHDGLAVEAIAVAAEEPYPAVPPKVAEHLAREGFDVKTFKPRRVNADDLAGAVKIVSIDCDLEKVATGGQAVERWDGVPKVSEDLEGSVAAIRKRAETLASTFGSLK
jgi:protein-tyrosine-phosphatase